MSLKKLPNKMNCYQLNVANNLIKAINDQQNFLYTVTLALETLKNNE